MSLKQKLDQVINDEGLQTEVTITLTDDTVKKADRLMLHGALYILVAGAGIALISFTLKKL